MKCACEMKGYLSFLVLWLVGSKKMSGAEIAAEIKRRKGTKPSPGTIYPVLKELRGKGLIRENKSNKNQKIYSLSPRGRTALRAACHQFCRTFHDLKSQFDKFEH
jgi:PadR family transcriptional regulator PadR